jgi:hypothetical protein
MLMEMENLNMQLKEEQNRVLTLQNELKFGTTNNRKIIEVGKEKLCDHLLNENVIDFNHKSSHCTIFFIWFYICIVTRTDFLYGEREPDFKGG